MADYTEQVNTDIEFEDISLNNPTGFYWDFGDGTLPITTSDKIIIHKYTSTGTYDITHKSTNECGTGECIVKTIEITSEAPPKEFGTGTAIVAGIGLGILYNIYKSRNMK